MDGLLDTAGERQANGGGAGVAGRIAWPGGIAAVRSADLAQIPDFGKRYARTLRWEKAVSHLLGLGETGNKLHYMDELTAQHIQQLCLYWIVLWGMTWHECASRISDIRWMYKVAGVKWEVGQTTRILETPQMMRHWKRLGDRVAKYWKEM
jgi:hypothetical protein